MTTEAETRAKAKAFDNMMAASAADPRAARRKAALQRVAQIGGPIGAEAKRILASGAAADAEQARAAQMGRRSGDLGASMHKTLAAMGIKPAA